MRQVLFRINIADLWSLEPLEGVTGIGAGYFLLLAGLVWGVLFVRDFRRIEPSQRSSLLGRLVGPAVLVSVVVFLSQRTPGFMAQGIPIFGYGAMVFLGFAFGGWTALRRAERAGINPDAIWDLITWVFVAGIGGARIFYLVQKHETVFANVSSPGQALFKAVNLTDGGLVLLGGVIAVVLAIIAFCHRRGISPLRMGDVLIPSFFIGLGFGRIGCLLNGCCFGDRCTLPWSLHFPAESVPWSVLVGRGFLGPEAPTTYGLHPTQIYSSIAAFALAGLTAAYFRRRPFDGAVVVLGMLLYAIKRFIVEFLRGDELGQFGTIFTISQWISTGIFVGGLVLMAWLIFWNRERLPKSRADGPVPSQPV